MALPKYFSKDLMAINRLINCTHDALGEKLNSIKIAIAFDENAVNTFEGNCGLDMLIRLLSRLYPKIKLIDLSGKNLEKLQELEGLCRRINSNIDLFTDQDENILILAGKNDVQEDFDGMKIYFGSDNWISKYSVSELQSFGKSNNPFGAGIAACIVASNIFKSVFKDFLKYSSVDEKLSFSVKNLKCEMTSANPPLGTIKFDDVVLVGVGAIGNGVLWALANTPGLKGSIDLVDDEVISSSNLQRYILFEEENIGKSKVNLAKGFFSKYDLNAKPFNNTWSEYINKVQDQGVNCVAVAIDNAKDRIGVQSSLPKTIFNAFTEPESIGITRHLDFVEEACLACSHIPMKKEKDYLNEVADNCNISEYYEMVKDYFNLDKPVNDNFPPKYHQSLLEIIAIKNEINLSELSQFNGLRISEFYSDFVCGGIILELSNLDNEVSNIDAPLAFQSAMAGIFLAAELVNHFEQSDLVKSQRTDIYHLTAMENLFNPYHRLLEKDTTGRCLCVDTDFINRYNEKWKA